MATSVSSPHAGYAQPSSEAYQGREITQIELCRTSRNEITKLKTATSHTRAVIVTSRPPAARP